MHDLPLTPVEYVIAFCIAAAGVLSFVVAVLVFRTAVRTFNRVRRAIGGPGPCAHVALFNDDGAILCALRANHAGIHLIDPATMRGYAKAPF